MKILQVVHAFPPASEGGTEIYTHNLSKELTKKHRVFIFCRISDPRRKEYEIKEVFFDGLDIFSINNTFRLCNSFEMFYKNEAITEKFIKILDKIKPDIVHIQHLIFLSTLIIAEIKKRKIPVVFTLHDYWLICPQWHFLKKDFTTCDNNIDISQCLNCLDVQLSIKKMPKRIYLAFRNVLPNFIIHFLKNIYLNLAKYNLNSQKTLAKIETRLRHIKELCSMIDLFIAPSQFLRKKFIEFGISEDKIKFISHGINIELFKNFRRKK
jgi:glycosyltransferase involved in cell wall biosynthesis